MLRKLTRAGLRDRRATECVSLGDSSVVRDSNML